MPSLIVPWVPGMDYGVGVDTASGEARNVAATGAQTTIPDAGGGTAAFEMKEVSTVEDLMNSLDIGVSVSGGFGLFSASARMDYAKSCSVHSSSVFLYVSVKVNEAFTSIKSPGISQGAADLYANGQETRFQEEFGDMFVRGLFAGGQFIGVIEVSTTDESSKQSVSAGLAASYAAFGAAGTFDSKFSSTVSTHSTSVKCYIEGGQISPLPTNLTTMTQAISTFPGTVKGDAVPYRALLDSYSILPLPSPPNFVDLQHQKDVLAQCAAMRNRDWALMNDINYIVAHPEEFLDVAGFASGPLLADLGADLNVLDAAASQALNNPKTAAFPTNLTVAAVPTLPKRIDGNPMVLVPDLIGVAYPGPGGQDPRLVQASADFQVSFVRGVPKTGWEGTQMSVYQQDPAAGTTKPKGSPLTLTCYDDGN